MNVGFVTYSAEPEITSDDRLAVPHLERMGISVSPLAWDMPHDLSRFDALVLRSCWNYHRKALEFETWISAATKASILLINQPLQIAA